MKWNYFSR